jgi:hypothetical protein
MKFIQISVVVLMFSACAPQNQSDVSADFVDSYDSEMLDYFAGYAGMSFVFETEYPKSLSGGFSGMVFDIIKGDILQQSKGERPCNIRVGNQFLHKRTNGGLDLPGGSGKLLNLCDLFYQYRAEYDLGKNEKKSFKVVGDTSSGEFVTDEKGRITRMETRGKDLGTVRIYSQGAQALKGFGPIIIK